LRFTAISYFTGNCTGRSPIFAAQDAIDISGGATKGVYPVESVGEQAAVSGKGRIPIDRRYVVSGRRQYDRRAMRDEECIRHDDKTAARLAPRHSASCVAAG
jgi:hypothetical protein